MKDAVLIVHETEISPQIAATFSCLSTDQLDTDLARSAAAFLLDVKRSGDVEAALRRIRAHPSPTVYLKPAVLLSHGPPPDPRFERVFDAVWDWAAAPATPPPGIVAALERIRRQASAFEAANPAGDTQRSFKLLRFMATRSQEFVPEHTTRTQAGFSYPPLDTFFDENGGIDVPETLAALEAQHVLAGRFVARIHACTHCSCAFLNFQEVCPHCAAADLTAEELVHHFRCGYTAPLADFEGERALRCPKCDRDLRQIGVDYDKPSMIFTCNECSHTFQDPEVTSTCFDCGRTAPPELQLHREIKAYRVTALGENAALHGLDSLFMSVLRRRVQVFEYGIFKSLIEVEAARIDRYGVSKSSLVVLSLEGIEHAYAELGQRAREVFEELTRTFNTVLRRSDLLTARNDSLFLALLTETGTDDARRAIERLREAVDELLQAHLQQPPKLNAAVLPITAEMEVESVVDRFVESYVA